MDEVKIKERIHESDRLMVCQLCGDHYSKHRRKCPICERLIAPGCFLKEESVWCWSDELGHCKECHALICILKHHRLKAQQTKGIREGTNLVIKSNKISYMDFPVEIQFNIMSHIIQNPEDPAHAGV